MRRVAQRPGANVLRAVYREPAAQPIPIRMFSIWTDYRPSGKQIIHNPVDIAAYGIATETNYRFFGYK
jgi:hypothetical protein